MNTNRSIFRKACLFMALFLMCSEIHAQKSITGIDAPYRDMCLKAATDPYYFQRFRSLNEYTHALEISKGAPFADYITNQASEEITSQLNAFKKLDTIGNPQTAWYPSLGNFSATTLRYITVADEIHSLFTLPENPKIVEIGAGFGGQCFVLSKLYEWSKYYIYDLPEPSALIKKVVMTLGVPNVLCLPCTAQLPEEKVDLFISNYAYSECDRETQLYYLNRVIKKADRGYIIYNQISHYFSLESLSPREFVELLEKNGIFPRVGNELVSTFAGNLLITWDKTK